MGKIRFEKDPPPLESWTMQRMQEVRDGWGNHARRIDTLPAWAESAVTMLRMVEPHEEVKGLGFRYSDDVFYLASDLEKEE